jgi:hypothetical protein
VTSGGIDLGIQLVQNGGYLGQVNWTSVGVSALAGAALSGLAPSGWLLGRGGTRAAQFGYDQSPGLLNRGATRFGWSYNSQSQSEVLSARVGKAHFDIPGTSIPPGANPVRDALIAGTAAGGTIGGAGTVAGAPLDIAPAAGSLAPREVTGASSAPSTEGSATEK